METKAFFDKRTYTLTYVVYDAASRDALIIDAVLDYDPASSSTFTESVEAVMGFVQAEKLKTHYILETHAHADHLSGSQWLKKRIPGAQVGIGERIREVQGAFKKLFDLPADFPTDGRQFDHLFTDGENVRAGSLEFEVIFTPGHTPADVTFRFGETIFTGDAMFMPDFGTGRCDFPAGSAEDMYRSVTEKLYTLPDDTRVFVGHDYQPGGRELAYQTTIAEEKAHNVQLPAGRGLEDFVRFRTDRDKTLNAPQLLFQSVQVNIDGGNLPDPSANEVRYLKIPVNLFKPLDVESEEETGQIVQETV